MGVYSWSNSEDGQKIVVFVVGEGAGVVGGVTEG